MKAKKFAPADTRIVDLGTKIIYNYPSLPRLVELNHMVVNGRHPEDENKYVLEHDCQFILHVIRAEGKIYAGNEIFDVDVGDVVHVPTNTKFAAEGEGFEYITANVPAWYPDQAEVVKG